MTFQDMLDLIEQLSIEDQNELFELVRKRRIEQRRSEIAASAQRILQAGEPAKKGSFADIKSYLLEDDEE